MNTVKGSQVTIKEATIQEMQQAFTENKLTSKQLVNFYLNQIQELNPLLHSVLEVNPDAIAQAEKADQEREINQGCRFLGDLHGIPVLLKDNIATKDKLNTTGGSYALLGSEVAVDAHVVERLRNAGAVILGKASLSEWSYFRARGGIPSGWCARGGQAVNPYVEGGDPCGSSSGSAISVAASMVAVSLGTETNGSILCPSDHNSVVGLKPTVGLTSRSGVIPISRRQDSVGPICRNVLDVVYVLDTIVGFDPRDCEATKEAAEFVPADGYKQFLKKDGLRGKRLGIVRNPFVRYFKDEVVSTFDHHVEVLRQGGATVVDNLEIANIDVIMDSDRSGENVVMLAEFKETINKYLEELVESPVRSLADIIAFNTNNPELENLKMYGQELLIDSEKTNGLGEEEIKAVKRMERLSQEGFEKMMKENELDVMVTLGTTASTVLAIGGYPAITVPAGYDSIGMPFGICFGGLKGMEPKLIEVAYSFEQATLSRKPPCLAL
ncbi:unnamed protein product [Dovyalis caffra]|uniref:Amidase domain-containing protein n=1 Tax=Dovyalis caffra TaxID=77055 RepID=A0AAV1R907_9ROSI|nr:unnamed protein product [Dovyalis caffra]